MRLSVPILAAIGITLVLAIPIWLAIISTLGVVMPWFMIGFVLWAVMAAGRGPRRQRGGRHQWGRHYWQAQPWPSSRVPDPSPAQPRPEPQPAARAELPIDVQVKVEQIRRKVDVLLGYASRFPPFSKDLYLVRQTASDYLPRTIQTYLALPPVDQDRIVARTGRTALEELKCQLDLLDSKLDDIAEDLQRRDVDALLANRRFLEERFGRTVTPVAAPEAVAPQSQSVESKV